MAIDNRIITPEVILQKLSDRLRSKTHDLEYLIYMEKGIEKWIQCELALSFSGMLAPLAYDEKYGRVKENNDTEAIFDIVIEYNVSINESQSLRCDLAIAETPFILEYADENTWQISDSDIEKCCSEYQGTPFHYIEFKHERNWIGVSNTGSTSITSLLEKLSKDIEKYSDLDWRSWKPGYHPRSIINIVCVPFYNADDQKKMPKKVNIEKVIQEIGEKVINKCRAEYKDKEGCHFLWQKITSEIYLLMSYYLVG